jgi:phosphopantothenoylcysteine decarboxylase/phosphopantothenate--cysteine ligase
VAGPVALATPEGVRRIDVGSAEEMFQACQNSFPKAHLFFATAAVGDYRPSKNFPQKMKKNGSPLRLELQPNSDILLSLGRIKKKGQIVVGFAAETESLLTHAKQKLKKKNLDLIVANDVSQPGVGFGSEHNRVTLIDRRGKAKALGKMPKAGLAERILDEVETLLSRK